jgi:hypothetical protein
MRSHLAAPNQRIFARQSISAPQHQCPIAPSRCEPCAAYMGCAHLELSNFEDKVLIATGGRELPDLI